MSTSELIIKNLTLKLLKRVINIQYEMNKFHRLFFIENIFQIFYLKAKVRRFAGNFYHSGKRQSAKLQ